MANKILAVTFIKILYSVLFEIIIRIKLKVRRLTRNNDNKKRFYGGWTSWNGMSVVAKVISRSQLIENLGMNKILSGNFCQI